MKRPVLFLDDGGVMNDNQVRGQQWPRLTGEFFPPILGGTPELWADANRIVARRLSAPEIWRPLLRASRDAADFYRRYNLAWLGGLCEHVGVSTPSPDNCLELADQATSYVTRRVRSAIPGVVETIRRLRRDGYHLHTASGERSRELDGYLEGMTVRDCFGQLYGPDLVKVAKIGPEYYQRIFEDAGVAPVDALVVDDNPEAVGWASRAGARAVLVSAENPKDPNAVAVVPRLALLPQVLEQLA